MQVCVKLLSPKVSYNIFEKNEISANFFARLSRLAEDHCGPTGGDTQGPECVP